MRNLFNSVPRKPINYNKFDLSFPNSFTADYGVLYPCLVKPVYAGEVMRDFAEDMLRTQPLRAPAFVRSDASVHFFFVPYRLVYDDWSKFIVRGDDGNTDYVKPYIATPSFKDDLNMDSSLFRHGSLMDYLNFPTLGINQTLPDVRLENAPFVDMMPFNAYSLIYNEYYRDENLIPEVFIWHNSGYSQNLDEYEDYVATVQGDMDNPTSEATHAQAVYLTFPMHLRYRSWRKDYFTSALPFVQKGTPISLAGAVQGQPGQWGIPVLWSSSAPYSSAAFVLSKAGSPVHPLQTNPVDVYFRYNTASSDVPSTSSGSHNHSALDPAGSVNRLQGVVPIDGLQSTVMTVQDLRVAFALQQWFELNARTGSDRYFEYLLGHFGVRDRDSRLQRPEYLGGYTHSIQISEVEQTSSSDDVTPQGNLAGKGLGFARSHAVRYRFPEPGFLMAIYSVRPQAVYWQGMPRQYQNWDNFDYYDPLFDHLSEEAIFQSELDFDWSFKPRSAADDVFGYTPRNSYLRASYGECHGDFRESLNYWVSPRKLEAPKLDRSFIEVNGYDQELYQMFAYPGTAQAPSHHFIVHMYHNLSILRPMSKYATPI